MIIVSLKLDKKFNKLRSFFGWSRGFIAVFLLNCVILLLLITSFCFIDEFRTWNHKEWKTYTNNTLGFKVKYPNTLTAREVGPNDVCFQEGIIEGPHEEDGFCVWSAKEGKYDDPFVIKKKQEYLNVSSQEFLVDNEKAVYLWKDDSLYDIFFTHRDRAFVVYGEGGSAFLRGKGYETFRFID